MIVSTKHSLLTCSMGLTTREISKCSSLLHSLLLLTITTLFPIFLLSSSVHSQSLEPAPKSSIQNPTDVVRNALRDLSPKDASRQILRIYYLDVWLANLDNTLGTRA